MSGIFPRNGLSPGVNNTGIATAAVPVAGCEALYYNEACAQKVDPKQLNALISELVAVLNACPIAYNCAVPTNLLAALDCRYGAPEDAPSVARGPDVIISNQIASETGPTPPGAHVWTKNVLNTVEYSRVVGLLELQGSGAIKMLEAGTYYMHWMSHQAGSDDAQSRLKNITSGIVMCWGLSIGQNSDNFASQTSGGAAVFTVAANDHIAIEQYFSQVSGGIAWGDPLYDFSTGAPSTNCYGRIVITKIS